MASGSRRKPGLVDTVFGWLEKPARQRRMAWHRDISISSQVLAYVRACGPRDQLLFAELLLKLDADPAGVSIPILRHGLPPGMRWTTFGCHRIVIQWDPTRNRVALGQCEASEEV